MSAKTMYELKDMLCSELDEIVKKGEISIGDLEAVHKLTDTIKNIDKISMLEEDGYSYGEGDWNASGTYSNGNNMRNNGSYNNGSYNNGSYGNGSYNNGGYSNRRSHYVRGHYSRGQGETAMITNRIEEMMREENLSGEDQNILRRALAIIGQ